VKTDRDSLELSVRELAAEAGLTSVDRVTPLGIGYNTLFDIDDKFVIRIGTSEDGECFPKSAEILRLIDRKIAAPRLVHSDFTKKTVPYNVLILEKVHGWLPHEFWLDSAAHQRGVLLADLGRQIAELHAQPVADLQHMGEPFHVSVLRDALANLDAAASAGRIASRKLTRVRDFILEHASVLDVPRPCLTHCDLHCNNMLFSADGLAGLLDFDDATLGDPMLDLHSLVDPRQSMQWAEFGQDHEELFRIVSSNYPLEVNDLMVTKLKLLSLLEASYGFAPSDRAPVYDLPEANLRYRAVFDERRYERLADTLSR
jgi:aminoglycoside phosphotransferase (APT) family kinase protein